MLLEIFFCMFSREGGECSSSILCLNAFQYSRLLLASMIHTFGQFRADGRRSHLFLASLHTGTKHCFIYFSNYVNCDFDRFRVDTHLCKLRDTPTAPF